MEPQLQGIQSCCAAPSTEPLSKPVTRINGYSPPSTAASSSSTVAPASSLVRRSFSDGRCPSSGHHLLHLDGSASATGSLFDKSSVSFVPTPTESTRSRPTWRSSSPPEHRFSVPLSESLQVLRALPPKPGFPPPQNTPSVVRPPSGLQPMPEQQPMQDSLAEVLKPPPPHAPVPATLLREVATPCRRGAAQPKGEEVPRSRFEQPQWQQLLAADAAARRYASVGGGVKRQVTAERLRQEVQRLCTDVEEVLGPGPDAAKVGALLSNIDAILVCPSG